jgi:superoxide reductase
MKKFDNYKCEICGNMVFVKQSGRGELVCCGKKMKLVEATKSETGGEKHLPVVENIGDGKYQVTIGSVHHPMTSEHYIEWVEVLTDKMEKIIKFFEPNESPEFTLTTSGKIVNVEAYCNIHGLWSVNL